MTKRINLLKKQKRYAYFQEYFSKLKIAIIVEMVVFLIIYPIFYYFLSQKRLQIESLSAKKKELLEFLLQNKTLDAKFVYFRNRQKQLSVLVKQDLSFLPYYNLLKESTETLGGAGRLESVLIDKSKAASFTLGFDDYTSLIAFLKYAESEDFLRNFTQLFLTNITNKDRSNNTYKLTFSGKFVNLYDN